MLLRIANVFNLVQVRKVRERLEHAGDAWVDARGMFMAAVAAGPVYRVLNKRDLGTTEFPAIETPLVSGEIAFRQHSGGHTPGPNWPTFLDYAARYFNQ